MKTNIIKFPNSRRFVLSISDEDIHNDMLTIANYFDSTAKHVPFTEWLQCMADECRNIAKEMTQTPEKNG